MDKHDGGAEAEGLDADTSLLVEGGQNGTASGHEKVHETG